MNVYKLLKSVAIALPLVLFATLSLAYGGGNGTNLSFLDRNMVAEGGVCTWHFVHHKYIRGEPSDLTVDFEGATMLEVIQAPVGANKKVRHYDVVSESEDGTSTLVTANIPGRGYGYLRMTHVSCEPFVEPEPLLACPCWNDLTRSGLLALFNAAPPPQAGAGTNCDTANRPVVGLASDNGLLTGKGEGAIEATTSPDIGGGSSCTFTIADGVGGLSRNTNVFGLTDPGGAGDCYDEIVDIVDEVSFCAP